MEKLQIIKRVPDERGQHVRLEQDLLKEVRELSIDSGHSIKKVVDMLLRYALANTEVIDSNVSIDLDEN